MLYYQVIPERKELPFTRLWVSSVAQLCPTLCDPMDGSTPGFPVLYQLPELVQTHVHWVGDAVQPSHHLSPPPPPAFTLSQHHGLFQWVCSFWPSSSASALLMSIQGWFPLEWTGLICLHPKGLSRVFLNITVQRHQFFGAQPFLLSNSHIYTWLLKNPQLRLSRPLSTK